jgi:ATP-dependent DNA helicase RecG
MPEAAWEVAVNAIIHRDDAVSDDVQVRICDNRIELESRTQSARSRCV